jgi:hypothetical protein
MTLRAPTSCAAAVLAIALFATRAPAQEGGRAIAEPYLPAQHWAQDALRRLAGLGLVDASAALDAWPARRSEARAAFEQAVRTALQRGNGSSLSTATQIAHRFAAEFPAPSRDAHASARMFTGWGGRDGTMLGGVSTRGQNGQWIYPGPIEAQPLDGVVADASADATWHSLSGAARWRGLDESRFSEAWIALAAGPIDAWAGRRSLSIRTGSTGGIVLSPMAPFTGFGLRTSRPIALPGFLEDVDVRGAFLLSRIDNSGDVRRPWFSAARLSIAPSSSLVIGLNRAALFGGAGNVEDLSVRNVVLMSLGLTSQLGKDSGFENQVASIDVWWRAAPFGLPVVGYAELGIDDVGFSMFQTAGFIAGITLPAIPGAGPVSAGVEHVRFPGSCCGHPPWYRHGDLADGWTTDGRLMAHPLGGHGHEWSLLWNVSTMAAHVAGRVTARERGVENLFAPVRAGSSLAASIDATIPFHPSLLFRSELGAERGSGWSAWTVDLGVQFLIGAEGGAPTVNRNARADVREQNKRQ